MIIGVPKEIKNNEYRVAMVPCAVKTLIQEGHQVMVEKSAGVGAGIADKDYADAGADIKSSAIEVFQRADMIVKVKEPQPSEYSLLQEGQILFTYLHLAPALELTKALLQAKIVGIAYETVQMENGSLPLLTPMSEIAGKLSVQVGAHYLEKENGGSGVLLGGVPGVHPAKVVVVGGGTVGGNAASIALGMGAAVTILDVNLERLRYLDNILHGRLSLLASNSENIEAAVIEADLVIGSLLIPGARAKKVINRMMISRMRKGSVVVDVAIDQGGCVETSHPTTFENPIFVIDGVIQYCVANMPGCVSRTSTFALTNATFPYILRLANMGINEAMNQDVSLKRGLNLFQGRLTNNKVAEALGLDYSPY
jgi:alanine dehydrogenase